jgi:cyclic pyranopterin phosphate synthase
VRLETASPPGLERRTLLPLQDGYGRRITDLRISITDRCNFRCFYCKSADPMTHSKFEAMSLDEIVRLAGIFAGMGIEKIRLTGGEPLLRAGVEKLVERIAKIPGIRDLALTTNGWLLPEKAQALKDAGLTRINISMDSVHREKFAQITRTDAFDKVIAGIQAAKDAKLQPVKVNAVLVRGLNDDEVEEFATFAREHQVIVRFIEFMPLDADRHWTHDLVVTAEEVRRRIHAVYPLANYTRDTPSETARKFRFADGKGEIGLVAPVSLPFCGFCSRIRLTSDAKVRTCLFSTSDHDLRPLLASGADDPAIAEFIRDLTLHKEERHHINDKDFVPANRSMVFIGG